MKRVIPVIFCCIIIFIFIENNAYANIAPLTVKEDGVEPLMDPGVKIESASIVVSSNSDGGFKFNCNYVFKGLQDGENLTVGIPGDMGYTPEAGYINDMNITVNGRPVKYKTYDTTKNLSEEWINYNSPLHFKWHTFPIPIKKDSNVFVSVAYNISWRMLEHDKSSSPYNIVPFILSTDKLFGNSSGSYKIKYTSDDYINPADVKVMVNSMLEPNIISPAIFSPVWNDSEISWEFKNPGEFQDFRLISLSIPNVVMEFSAGDEADPSVDHTIKWAMMSDNHEKLASIFEGIAKKTIQSDLDSNALGTAAYLSSEFYFRQKKYDKALEMLSLSNNTNLWPEEIKQQYISAVSLAESKNYAPLLDELNKLHQYKDYILIYDYASKQMDPVTNIVKNEQEEKKQQEQKLAEEKALNEQQKIQNEKSKIRLYYISISVFTVVLLLYFIFKRSHGRS